MTAQERAEKVAHDLFTDGEGRTCCRLSLDNDKELGWGKHVLADRIQEAIESAVAEAVLEEAKWWRHLAIMDEQGYFAVEGDKHIADLERRLQASQGEGKR